MSSIQAGDDARSARTLALVTAAENISYELTLQTERLAETISSFHRDVLEPLRQIREEHREIDE